MQDAEAKYGTHLKFVFFFLYDYSNSWKKSDKSIFLWLALLFKHILIKIQTNMSEQEEKRKRIYDLFNAETRQKNSEIIRVSL